jgi:hypothetical protein
MVAEDAVGYFLAAKKVVAGEGPVQIISHYRMPFNFLLGQCCELALKAMLVSKGWDRKRLNPIRHDLMGLLAEAKKEGFTITSDFAEYCRIMGDAHKDFDFRYSGHASPPWIGHDDAFKMLEPQIRAIAPFGMP